MRFRQLSTTLFNVAATMLVLSVLSFPSLAGEPRAENILFVFSWHRDMPWQKEVEQGFEQHFRAIGKQPNLYFEYMDAGRFSENSQISVFRNYLSRKFSTRRLDHVVFESAPAASLFIRSPHLFPKVDTMILNPGTTADFRPRSPRVIPVKLDFESSIREILSFSNAKTVYLVAGVTTESRERVHSAGEILSRIAPRLKVVSLSGLPMEQLLEKVAALDPDGIIIYLLLFQDGNGARFIPYQAARQISERANVPVYSLWTSLMGSGILGGYMLSGEQVGREAAARLMDREVNMGSDLSELSKRFHGFYFDYRQLKRWDLSDSRLPQGSNLVFKQPSLAEEYFLEIGISIAVMILMFVSLRYRELKKYNMEMNRAHQRLQSANTELGLVKNSLEEKNKLLRELSITDSMTGLFNRGHLDERMREEVARVRRYAGNLSIVLVDIDHFKNVNDRFGHQVGDRVLAQVAQVLQQNIRSNDILGRWGGEEFMIICPNLELQQAVSLAEKLRELIALTNYEPAENVTCSFGVASYIPDTHESRLIRDADSALYAAKHSGRNCVQSNAQEVKA